MTASKNILVIEDEAVIAMDMESTLTELGHTVTLAMDADEARQAVQAGGIDLAVVDFHLKDGTSQQLVSELRAAQIAFVICSGSAAFEELGEMFRNATFLPKPFTTDGLVEAIAAESSRFDA